MNIYHCYSLFDNMFDSRYQVASETWKIASLIPCGIHEKKHSRLLDDGYRKVPFVKDIIDLATENIADESDYIIFLTNSDSCLVPSISDTLKNVTSQSPQVYARREIPYSFKLPLTETDLYDKDVFGGKDGFAFTKSFWIDNREKFLDMVFGAEFWDYIFYLQLNILSSFSLITIDDKLYHRMHPAKWCDERYRTSLPSQCHNIHLAKEFLYKNIQHIDRMDYFKDWENTIFKVI